MRLLLLMYWLIGGALVWMEWQPEWFPEQLELESRPASLFDCFDTGGSTAAVTVVVSQ